MIAYYFGMSLTSFLLLIAYLFVWHKRFDVHITLIFALVPIANLGYALVAHAHTLEAALVATKMAYVGACYLLLILMLAAFDLCDIKVSRRVRIPLFCLSTVVFFSVLTIGELPIYYEDVSLGSVNGVTVLNKKYGPMHDVYILMEIAYLFASLGALLYSLLHKNQVSRKNLALLLLTEVISAICFFGGRQVLPHVELLPLAYNISLVVYLHIAYRLGLYDVANSAADSLAQTGATGFVSFDFKRNYLGSNAVAKDVFPQLNELTVDKPLAMNESLAKKVQPWINAFEDDPANCEFHYEKDNRVYQVNVQYLCSGRFKKGYQLFIIDNTDDQKSIRLLNSFNEELQREVERKTAHIVEMHDNLVMGMAVMVEGRDNSTGDHIWRASEVVRILVDEMRADGVEGMTDAFCRNVVKAAPMHDLGKIVVDDAVLRKPGRFSEEGVDAMRRHAAEGARLLHEVLRDTDDEGFRRIAENVAHYHHERWDGSGYPEGLAGEEIPLEARIMAVADVYDALVSERPYKKAMSFEEADAIIREGMGTQFDAALEPYYLRVRPRIEEFYLYRA